MRPLLLTLLAALMLPTSAHAAFVFTVPGGVVDVRAFPGQPQRVQDAVEDTLAMEAGVPGVLPIDAKLCATGRIIITAEKAATMKQQYLDAQAEPKSSAGLFLKAKRAGQHCRIFLNARALKRYDEAQLCHITQHELGHARGLSHTKTGLMAPILPFVPKDGETCQWAWSDWNAWADE